MKRTVPASSPDAYVVGLRGWQADLVPPIRAAIRSARGLQEVIKWGHLVYLGDGPILLLRAEAERVLLGFWLGQRLREIEPRLKPGGKFEMATLELRENDSIPSARVRRLVRRALELAKEFGDATKLPAPKKRGARKP
ncbi:MAG: DUF1801 domain-containing protein [Gemmatimonadaceae bacterium]|nr:DUF1801 domain-containing protein [Gemmatimonadaceae bacterium]